MDGRWISENKRYWKDKGFSLTYCTTSTINLKVLTRKFSVLSPTITRSRLLPLIGFPLWLLPSLRGSLVLLPSLALVTLTNRSSQRFFRAPSDPLCKVILAKRTESRGDQSQRKQGDWRATLRRKDPRRSANRREPAELLHPPKNLWDSTFKSAQRMSEDTWSYVIAYNYSIQERKGHYKSMGNERKRQRNILFDDRKRGR